MSRRTRRVCFVLAALQVMHILPLTLAEQASFDLPAMVEPTQEALDVSETETEMIPGSSSTEAVSEINEPAQMETPEPTEAPELTETPESTEAPELAETPEPTEAPELTETPESTEAPAPTETPESTEEPVQTEDPSVLETPVPEESPELEDQQPEDIVPEATPVIEKPERDNSIGWKGVEQTDEQGMLIPMLFQGDYRTLVCYYDGIARSVATSGCGAVSVSMIIAYLTGNVDQNPYKLFCQAVDEGKYYGNGLSHATLSGFLDEYGIQSRWIENDAEKIVKALEEGKPVIAHMGEGIFTEKGHYIVLRGVTEGGKILVNDPNQRSNCTKAFPVKTLIEQARRSESFCICWIEPEQTVEPAAEPAINAAAEATIEPAAEPTVEPAAECMLVMAVDPVQSGKVWGDINGSGVVDMNDVQLLYDIFKGLYEEPVEESDLNGDGMVDVQDVMQLTAYIRDGIMPPEASGADPKPVQPIEAESAQ